MAKNITIENRKARHDYFISDTYEAGIALKGCEVKSVRGGKANLKDSYVRFDRGEAFVVSMHISEYGYSQEKGIDVRRSRKLLLHRSEIEKLSGSVSQKGYSIIPIKLYFKRGKAKLLIAICKGKHRHDKRQDLKKKVHEREMDRAKKQYKG